MAEPDTVDTPLVNVIDVDRPEGDRGARGVAHRRVVRSLRVSTTEGEVLGACVAGGRVPVGVDGGDREVVPAPAAGVVVFAARTRWRRWSELTVNDVEVPVTALWVTVSWVVWASYSVTVTVAAPLAKVVAVADPKLIAVFDEFFAVGTVVLGLLDGPEKTRL